jgi:hypothetical protein
MAYTSEQLTTLEAAIAQGALEVEYKDKRVKYRSLAEMNELRRQMQVELGTFTTNGRRFAEFSKGLE